MAGWLIDACINSVVDEWCYIPCMKTNGIDNDMPGGLEVVLIPPI